MMSPFLLYCKNLIQLVLAPSKAWGEISREELPSQELARRGFYPLMSIVGITAFCNGFYHPAEFNVGRQLQVAITQMVTLFISLMIARVVMDSALTRFAGCPRDNERGATVSVYALSLMAVISIIMNLCPVELTLLWFLPAFVAVTVWQARQYLEVNPERQGQYIVVTLATLIFLPVLLVYILGYLIVR